MKFQNFQIACMLFREKELETETKRQNSNEHSKKAAFDFSDTRPLASNLKNRIQIIASQTTSPITDIRTPHNKHPAFTRNKNISYLFVNNIHNI